MTTGRFLLGIALVVYGIYVLCISPFCSPAPFRRQECNTELGNCKLCTQCQQIVADPLLSGSNWPLVRSSRKYPFYSTGPLRSSAESCHLCSLLLRSLHRSSRLDVSHPTYDLTVLAVWLEKGNDDRSAGSTPRTYRRWDLKGSTEWRYLNSPRPFRSSFRLSNLFI